MTTPDKGRTIEVHPCRNDLLKVNEYPERRIGTTIHQYGYIKPINMLATKSIYKRNY